MYRCFLKDSTTLAILEEHWNDVLSVINEIQSGKYSNGSHVLSDRLMMNIFEYETNHQEEKLFEVHQEHIDIHVVLSGKEKIQLLTPDSYPGVIYDKESDSATFQEATGEEINCVSNDILVIDTEVAHKTGIILQEQQTVRKVVVKLKM